MNLNFKFERRIVMNKKNWIYRILQILFALAMGGSAFANITQNEQIVQAFNGLGYPLYLMHVLGVAYLLGIVGIFQNKVHFLKEWAYAGFTFVLLGAFFSHLIVGYNIVQGIPFLVVLLAIMFGAYFLEKQVQNS
jgi:hypothetical protein